MIGFAMVAPAYFIVDRWLFGLGLDILDGVRYGTADVLSAFWFLFNMTYLVGKTGQSWGRAVWGLRVVDRNNRPIGFLRALLRNLFAIHISWPVAYLGFLWILWDHKKQAWHDKVFRTYVVSRVG